MTITTDMAERLTRRQNKNERLAARKLRMRELIALLPKIPKKKSTYDAEAALRTFKSKNVISQERRMNPVGQITFETKEAVHEAGRIFAAKEFKKETTDMLVMLQSLGVYGPHPWRPAKTKFTYADIMRMIMEA